MMVDAISTALSGLNAATKRVEASASNIANSTTAGTLQGENQAFSALTVSQSSLEQGGVRAEIIPKDPGIVESFSPNSPFANEDGIIGVPNVNLAEEAVNLQLAEVAYKANIQVLNTINEINDELLNSFDERF